MLGGESKTGGKDAPHRNRTQTPPILANSAPATEEIILDAAAVAAAATRMDLAITWSMAGGKGQAPQGTPLPPHLAPDPLSFGTVWHLDHLPPMFFGL